MGGEQINGAPPPEESGGVNWWTPIPQRIHCDATPDTNELDELGLIDIDHFLDELAKIALAIVRRREPHQ